MGIKVQEDGWLEVGGTKYDKEALQRSCIIVALSPWMILLYLWGKPILEYGTTPGKK